MSGIAATPGVPQSGNWRTRAPYLRHRTPWGRRTAVAGRTLFPSVTGTPNHETTWPLPLSGSHAVPEARFAEEDAVRSQDIGCSQQHSAEAGASRRPPNPSPKTQVPFEDTDTWHLPFGYVEVCKPPNGFSVLSADGPWGYAEEPQLKTPHREQPGKKPSG